MFASEATKTLDLPFDPGQTVTIKKLTGRQYTTAMRHLIKGEPDQADTLVLTGGIVGWSYARALDADAVADLDFEASQFLAQAILTWCNPALFKTEDEAKADLKNDDGPST